MVKITLINPPSPWLVNEKEFPPLGIMYLSSYLKEHCYSAEKINILDLAGKLTTMESELKKVDANICFITATTPSYLYAKLVNNILKRNNPNVKTVIGGAHTSYNPKKCLCDGFDYVVVGEGEFVSPYIAYTLLPSHIFDTKYEIPELDIIPFPDRDAIDIKSYGYNLSTGKATTLITSRGCPYNCAFCSKDVWSNKVRFHSANYVLSEAETIINNYGFKNLLFLDDCFTLDKKRLYEILNGLKKLNINWRCYARADQLDKETLIKMKESGCIEIGIGIESGSQKILDNVHKHTKVEDNYTIIREMEQIGIMANAFIVIGLPGETTKTVCETRKFMLNANPSKFGYNIFIPYPTTQIVKNPDKYDITIYDMPEEETWAKGEGRMPKSYVSTKELSREEIDKLYDENFNYFVDITGFNPRKRLQ